MPNIGPMEIAIVLIIALIVLGPKKLPDAGRSLGKGLREFKDTVSGITGGNDDDAPPRQVAQRADDGSGVAPRVEAEAVVEPVPAPAPVPERESVS